MSQPAPMDAEALALDQRLDRICGPFEAACKAACGGSPWPRIEDFLGTTRQPERSLLLRELLLLEIHYRRRQGDCIPPEGYQCRFPELDAAWLKEAIAAAGVGDAQVTQAWSPARRTPPLSSAPSREPLRFAPGQMLAGRYRIVAALGKGGMGEVYRADDLKLGQPVALKFLPQHLVRDPARLAYLHNEVRLARQVSHPNVCRVHDIGEADGQPFLSMEFVDGEDLASLLRRIGRLPPDKALEIARQLCLGLAAAHDKDVLHCDLKPANVMLDGQGQVRITDFGLARLADKPSAEANAGTPAYMAPEQLAGKEATERSDIYALGLLMHEVFTGQRAFGDGSLAEQALSQGQSVPPHPSISVSDLDPAIEGVILRCLENDPRDRPSSAVAVAVALTNSDPLVAGKMPSPLEHARRGYGQVFISYSRDNENLVLPVVSLLRASGQKVFVSIQDFEFGTDRNAQVAKAVRESTRFLLFWSKSSLASSLVGEEWQLALATPGCAIVPVVLDKTPLPPELERFHGTADLAPLFQTLKRRKFIRRLLWLSWAVLTVMLVILISSALTLHETPQEPLPASGPKVQMPNEDFAFFLLNLATWLFMLFVPVLILQSWYRSHRLYCKVAKSLGG